MIDKLDITVAILAGGKSRRFGSPKGFAKFKGRRLIEIASDIAGNISSKILIIGENQYSGIVTNFQVQQDIIPNAGPAGGIYTAMRHANTSYIATLPCDMPLITPQVYQILAANQTNRQPVVAASEKGPEPIIGIWPVTTMPAIRGAILCGKRSLRELMAQIAARLIYIPDCMDHYSQDIFSNINYRSDLQFLKNRLSGKAAKKPGMLLT
jgi:molybdopterin-guanine dinucleotide biosynthesis protein A